MKTDIELISILVRDCFFICGLFWIWSNLKWISDSKNELIKLDKNRRQTVK